MAPPSAQTLQRVAGETGYQPGTLEKAIRLLEALVEINRDPFLAGRLVLKGGTALNVFHLDLDRLSIDIDLNYIGALDRTVMESERPKIDASIDRLLVSQGYSVRRRPEEHAGGKWLSRYTSALGGNATLELDVNFMARQPLFGAARMESCNLGGIQASGILVLDIHEIVAGKIVALVSRHTARDLFDAHRILSIEGLDWDRVKTAVLAIGVCSRFDWRDASTLSIKGPEDSLQKLIYCLPHGYFVERNHTDSWVKETVAICQERFAFLFELSTKEQAFLDGVLDRGEINATLLKTDPEIRTRINAMPMLAWKAMRVRRHQARSRPILAEDILLTDSDEAPPEDERIKP